MMRKLRSPPGMAAASGKTPGRPAPQLTAYDHLAGCINAMHLKDRLRDIQADCRN
jgi:hypothetical protein